MNSKRLYFGMIGCLVVLALALVFGAHMTVGMLQQHSQTLIAQKLQVAVLNSQQQGIAKAKQEVTKYASLESVAKTIVPQDKDQAEAVSEIVKIADDNGLTLTAINFPSSTLGQAGATSSTSQKATLSQLTPVKGLSGIYNLPITITQDATSPVSYGEFINFLKQLEQNRRTAQVTNVSLTPNADNPSLLSFSLTINEYIKP